MNRAEASHTGEVDADDEDAFVDLIRPGLVLLTVATYPDGNSPLTGSALGYKVAVQMAREEDLRGAPRFDAIVRGTGATLAEAIAEAQAGFNH